MSKVIKSTNTNTSGNTVQLGIQSIRNQILTKSFEENDGNLEIDQFIEQKKAELSQLENTEQNLKKQVEDLEQTILLKQESLQKLEQELEEQSQQIKQTAHQIGLEAGYQEGITKAELEYEQLLANAREITLSIETERLNRIEKANETIINLAVKMARKIIGDTFQDKSEAWHLLLQDAISEIKENGEIKVYVHPSQFNFTVGLREDLELNSQVSISVYPDSNLKGNQCLIESRNGLLDASVDTQLEVLKERLIEVIKGE